MREMTPESVASLAPLGQTFLATLRSLCSNTPWQGVQQHTLGGGSGWTAPKVAGRPCRELLATGVFQCCTPRVCVFVRTRGRNRTVSHLLFTTRPCPRGWTGSGLVLEDRDFAPPGG